MDAQKHTVQIEIEVLDPASVLGLLGRIMNDFDDEATDGSYTASDGDHYEFTTTQEKVSF